MYIPSSSKFALSEISVDAGVLPWALGRRQITEMVAIYEWGAKAEIVTNWQSRLVCQTAKSSYIID